MNRPHMVGDFPGERVLPSRALNIPPTILAVSPSYREALGLRVTRGRLELSLDLSKIYICMINDTHIIHQYDRQVDHHVVGKEQTSTGRPPQCPIWNNYDGAPSLSPLVIDSLGRDGLLLMIRGSDPALWAS